MLTFFKLLFKFLELWRGIAEGPTVAEEMLDSIESIKDRIEKAIEEMNG